MVNIGPPATAGVLGVIAGIVAKLIHGRRSTNRRVKGIEASIAEMRADQAVKYEEFRNHRDHMTDAIIALRESVDRVDSKVDGAATSINEKLDATAEGVAYIRGQLSERGGRGRA